jgi:4a-hydroxytetrahydrobiopterin dehydratase
MWIERNNQLYKKFVFENFIEAFGFMTQVALLAERMNHHPYWTNVYNTVEIYLATHSAGNVITEKDIQMAEAIDRLCKN